MTWLYIVLAALGLLSGLCFGGQDDWPILTPDMVPKDVPSYSIVDSYCWLLAHTSGLIGTDGNYHLVVDGGMTKYKLNLPENGTVGVPDLNGYTVSVDLSKDFDVASPTLRILHTKKPPNTTEHGKPIDAPVVNRGGMWVTDTDVILVGGHFNNDTLFDHSVWHVDKADIPEPTLWRFKNAKEEGNWKEEQYTVEKDNVIVRTVSGAATCGNDACYWLGGYISTRTSATTPYNQSTAQRGMLVYDLGSKTLRNESIHGYGKPDEGYQFGTLHHIPSNDGKGLLISLMAEKQPISRPQADDDDLVGEGVSLRHVMLYDIENRTWYNQTTAAKGFEEPPTRTRFCTVLVNDTERNTWDLWLYGGKSVDNPSEGVNDIFVLSMPSFIWVRIEPEGTALGQEQLRSHTCHAVGSQLVIVGGGWPKDNNWQVDPRGECTGSLINVLNMNEPDGMLKKRFLANSPPYQQHQKIKKEVGDAREPSDGWADPRIIEIWPKGSKPRPPKAAIIGAVVGVVVVIALLLVLFLILRKRRPEGQPLPVKPADQTSRVELDATDEVAATQSVGGEKKY